MSTVVPVFLALRPLPSASGGTMTEACMLSAEQAAIVKSFALNGSCSYNQTIEEVLSQSGH